MVHLLDVSTLIAIIDQDHPHHDFVSRWFAGAKSSGWATCPITENGFLRILSNPKYPNQIGTLPQVLSLLEAIRESPGHQFWEDSLSLVDEGRFNLTKSTGHNSLTDLYLLALCVEKDARFATLDQRIDADRVVGGRQSLRVLRH